MKTKIFLLLLALCLTLSLTALASCGDNGAESDGTTTSDGGDTTEPSDGKVEYTIKITDFRGEALTESVFVEIRGEGVEQFTKTDKSGVAKLQLEKGDYTFTVSPSTDDADEFYYDASACTLTAEKTTAEVALYSKVGETIEIYPLDKATDERFPYNAPTVGVGGTYVEIDTSRDMCYFVFTPRESGIYKIGYISESALTLKCFGDANFVNENTAVEVVDRAFEFTVRNGSISDGSGGMFRLVIGLRSMKEKDCILTVERIADPPREMTYTDVASKEVPEKVERTDHLNNSLVNIDVTDKNVKVFYNETDNRYRYGSENGPVVYIRISSASPYLAAFTEICGTTSMHRFVYDDKGNIIAKEVYNLMIEKYAAVCDSNGVCPLTAELADAVKNVGDCFGWWGDNNIFEVSAVEGETSSGIKFEDVVLENAWLFACCYVKEGVIGTSDAPVSFDTKEEGDYAVSVKAGETVHMTAKHKGVLTVEVAAGLTVTVNGTDYTANSVGSIVINITEDNVKLTVKSESDGEMIFTYRAR
ncbi:MAG: hypothetical protein IJX46_06505 [Clostridia bacterium]|nr:hypothetical protein [Clostridia bacterium]